MSGSGDLRGSGSLTGSPARLRAKHKDELKKGDSDITTTKFLQFIFQGESISFPLSELGEGSFGIAYKCSLNDASTKLKEFLAKNKIIFGDNNSFVVKLPKEDKINLDLEATNSAALLKSALQSNEQNATTPYNLAIGEIIVHEGKAKTAIFSHHEEHGASLSFYHNISTVALLDGDLVNYLHNKKVPVSVTNIEDFINFQATGVMTAILAIHAANYLHLDVKADNVLIGEYGHPRLFDFGLSSPIKTACDRLDNKHYHTTSCHSGIKRQGDGDTLLLTADQNSDLFGFKIFMLVMHASLAGIHINKSSMLLTMLTQSHGNHYVILYLKNSIDGALNAKINDETNASKKLYLQGIQQSMEKYGGFLTSHQGLELMKVDIKPPVSLQELKATTTEYFKLPNDSEQSRQLMVMTLQTFDSIQLKSFTQKKIDQLLKELKYNISDKSLQAELDQFFYYLKKNLEALNDPEKIKGIITILKTIEDKLTDFSNKSTVGTTQSGDLPTPAAAAVAQTETTTILHTKLGITHAVVRDQQNERDLFNDVIKLCDHAKNQLNLYLTQEQEQNLLRGSNDKPNIFERH